MTVTGMDERAIERPRSVRRVLVVADEPEFADVLRAQLVTGGYAVAIAPTVAEAGRVRDSERFDLVVAELRLADGSGIDLLADERGGAPRPPVLIMAGLVSPEVRKLVEARGGAILRKPFSFGHLHATVIRVLTKEARRSERDANELAAEECGRATRAGAHGGVL